MPIVVPPPRRSSSFARGTVVATTLAALVAGTMVGVSTQRLVSADVSSGVRPVLVSITPCRLSDTRPSSGPVGPRSVPLGSADTQTINAQETDVPCSGQIPVDAVALSLNITALNASAQSFLTVWADGERPLAASLNPAPDQPPVPNAVTVELSAAQTFEIFNERGSVDVVIDVNGYYSNHDHDDRYPTDAEVAAEIDERVAAAIDDASVKFIQLPAHSAALGLNAFYAMNSGRAGVRIADETSNSSVGWSFVLPPDYTENTTFFIDVVWTIGESFCRVGWQRSASTIARPGSPTRRGDVSTTVYEELSGGVEIVNTFRVPWTPEGSGARAGDAVHVSFYRPSAGDSCTETMIVQGASVVYE